MIQIYLPSNSNYTMNGDMVLSPTSCEGDFSLNGTWELELEHPIDEEGRWEYIEEGAVIKAPSFNGDQLFRIYEVERTNKDITAKAEPIFMDSAGDVFLVDCRPTALGGQAALNYMLAGTSYTGQSNISTAHTAYYVRKNFIEALNGKDDNSFLNRWGGEILYDNFNVIVNSTVGTDRGTMVEYGKNITAIEQTVDMSDIITRIVPVAYNGYTLDGNEPWVDSSYIGSYPVVHTRLVKFEDLKLAEDCQEDEEGYATLADLQAAMVAACEGMYEDDVDKPKVTLKISMVDLAQCDEYKDFVDLERVFLGDTVHCKHAKLGITTNARVIRLKWDCINDRVSDITIGAFKDTYISKYSGLLKKASDVIRPDGSIMAEYIAGVLNLMTTRLAAQKNAAQRSDVRAILYEDTMETLEDGTPNPLYGALCIGTVGIQIAHTKDASGEWEWTTAIDANAVHAGTIITGILSDVAGRNYWNLDTGEFQLTGYATSEEVSTEVATAVNNLSQEDIFNLLTHNGTAEGIFLQDGQLYINMSYLSTGTLKVGGNNDAYGIIKIYDATGAEKGSIDSGGITALMGVFNAINLNNVDDPNVTGAVLISSDGMLIYANNDDASIPVIINNLSSSAADITTLGATTAWINACNATSLYTVDFTWWADDNRENFIMSKRERSDATYGQSVYINDSMIDRLSFKPYGTESGTTWYRPVASYHNDGNRVKYIASHSSSHSVANSIGVNGQFGSTADDGWTTKNFAPSSSDIRLKENIKDCEIEALPFIDRIQMRQFDWKRNGVHQDCGFVADELEELDENLAVGGGYNADGTMNEKSVNDFYLVGYLTKAVQELSAKVQDLEAKLQKLSE